MFYLVNWNNKVINYGSLNNDVQMAFFIFLTTNNGQCQISLALHHVWRIP